MTNMSLEDGVTKNLAYADLISDTRDAHFLVKHPNENFEQARQDIRDRIYSHESFESDTKMFTYMLFAAFGLLSLMIFIVNRDQFYSLATVLSASAVVLLIPLIMWLSAKRSFFKMKRDIKQIVSQFSESDHGNISRVELDVEENYIQALMSLPTRKSMGIFNSSMSKMYPKFLIDSIVSTDDKEKSASRIKMFVILAKKEGGF